MTDEQTLMFVFFCNQTDSAIQPCDDGGPFKDRHSKLHIM